MPNMEHAITLSSLSVPRQGTPQTRTAKQVADGFFSDMAARGTPMLKTSPDGWRKRWLASEKFVLMRVPLNCVALPCSPSDVKEMLRDIAAGSNEPILVDLNKPGVGRRDDGYVPPITVIDGKHRFAAASMGGATSILAWVGELAASRISGRREIRINTEARKERQTITAMDRAMALSANTKTVEPLHHIIGRHTGMDPLVVQKMVAQFKTIHSHKRFGPVAGKWHLEAKAPPGWSECVAAMKDHPEVDTPQLLAWNLYDQGMRGKPKSNGSKK